MEEKIINILSKKDNESLTISELSDYLELVTIDEYKDLQTTLDELCENGILYYSEKKKKYLLLSNSHLLKGKLLLNNKGFGFVEIDPNTKDIYIEERNIKDARNNDIVLVELITKGNRPEGKIIKIIKRDYTPIVGTVFIIDKDVYVKPDKNGKDIYIPDKYTNGVVEGNKVLVRPLKDGNYVGEIVDIIGHVNDVGIDILSFIYQYGFKPNIPKEAEDELEEIPSKLTDDMINEEIRRGRIDLRDKVIFTIDGIDTKDIDDAISIEKLENGNYLLGVHIADVSYYVKEGSELDKDAYARSTSVYLVDRVVPMIPHKLSNGICSLNPNEDRFAFSCIMEIDENGVVIDYKINESIIRSKKKMDYDSVNKVLEENIVPSSYEDYVDILKLMNELSNTLRKKMIDRGYMEFDSPESKILVDENCHPYKIELRSQRTGEKLIENFMIVANETVASHLYYQDLPSIYRVHDKPNLEKVGSFLNFLALRGYTVTGRSKITNAKDLQNILKQLKDKPDSMVLNDLAVRTQAKAKYSNDNIGHFGLGSRCYAHFTSPIRRYPDLTLHRILKSFNENYTEKTISEWEMKLPEICIQTSQKELDSVNCERDVEKYKKAEYMEDHIGEIYDGVISGVTPFGIFVELSNTVEGLVKFEDIPGDYFVYDESGYMIYGTRTNKRYMFGDTVRVKVIAANRENSTVDFIMLVDKNSNSNNKNYEKLKRHKIKYNKKNRKGKGNK